MKYSFERILDPKTASAYAGLYAQIESIDASDPAVAVFHLKSSFGPFLNNLATNGQIVNEKAIYMHVWTSKRMVGALAAIGVISAAIKSSLRGRKLL